MYSGRVVDSHAHVFSQGLMENIMRLDADGKNITSEYGLNFSVNTSDQASGVSGIRNLVRNMKETVYRCVLLPFEPRPERVPERNDEYLGYAREHGDVVVTLGTLHPHHDDTAGEIDRLARMGIPGIKLCSFSQGFDLTGEHATVMFEEIRAFNESHPERRLYVVLDTFYEAKHYFPRTDESHVTTPGKVYETALTFPEIRFVAAHLLGQRAPRDEKDIVFRNLGKIPNLSTDTSNVIHVMEEDETVCILKKMGPGRVLFGTDYPWHFPEEDVKSVDRLLDSAGFGDVDKGRVFFGNAAELARID